MTTDHVRRFVTACSKVVYPDVSASSRVALVDAVMDHAEALERHACGLLRCQVRQQAFDSYIPNGGPIPSYTLVDADDIVLVHVR